RRQRADDVPAFLLHATPWRETSLVINAFTRDYGVVGMVARGAKRPQSQLRPVLGAFQPLRLSWSGARELKTLRRAESAGIMPLAGRAYMSGWYLNELVLRLLAREDPHPTLFDTYQQTLLALTQGQIDDATERQPVAVLLRRFEWVLLQETGYGFEGEPPAFDTPQAGVDWRQRLRDRLDSVLERPLQT